MVINDGSGNEKFVILVVKSHLYFDGHAYPIRLSHFHHKIYFNALPLGDVVLGGNGNL